MFITKIGSYSSSKSNLSNSQVKDQQSFCGAKDGVKFRKIATELLEECKNKNSGDFRITSKERPLNIRTRLLDAIYNDASKIGKKHVTDEDRKLHETLKNIYKSWQEDDDCMDGMCIGGGHFVDQTIHFSI